MSDETTETTTIAHAASEACSPERLPTIAHVAYEHTLRVMCAVGGNKSRAAKILGIDRRTLYRHLEKRKAKQE